VTKTTTTVDPSQNSKGHQPLQTPLELDIPEIPHGPRRVNLPSPTVPIPIGRIRVYDCFSIVSDWRLGFQHEYNLCWDILSRLLVWRWDTTREL